MYVYKVDDNNNVGFKDSSINEITENDIEISDDNYIKFQFEQQLGKQFKLKDINGKEFDDIFEEIPLERKEIPKTEREIQLMEMNEQILNLQQMVVMLAMQGEGGVI